MIIFCICFLLPFYLLTWSRGDVILSPYLMYYGANNVCLFCHVFSALWWLQWSNHGTIPPSRIGSLLASYLSKMLSMRRHPCRCRRKLFYPRWYDPVSTWLSKVSHIQKKNPASKTFLFHIKKRLLKSFWIHTPTLIRIGFLPRKK